MVKGAALFLQQGNSPQGPRSLQHPRKHAGDLPQHLQVMINLLRCEDRIKLAVRLESAWAERVRYMVVVDSSGRQDTEESILLGVDFSSKESKSCTIGLVLRLWSDTKIHLDGDGGFSISTAGRMHVFKPVSVQAMWSALQVLHKACEVARRHNYFPGGVALLWATYYESCIGSDQSCLSEWTAMQGVESTRPDSPALFVDKPTEGERTEHLIRAKLRSIMMSQDLENVTSKEIRNELEKQMNCNLKEFKEFIDNEMLLILGQMDKPSLIFDHLYLGSEWNASNLEELQGSGVDYILNVTREIDNFFPGMFAYHNIRVYDEETTDLLAHWNEAYHFINKAKRNHSKCLVHCKMGVSRSASTVIAYAMKEFGWPLEKAYSYVKQKRSIARPNAGFMRQLSEYEGILDASKQRHNKLWRPQPEHSPPMSGDGPMEPGHMGLGSPDGALEAPDAAPQPGLSVWTRHPYCFRRLSDPLPHFSDEEPEGSDPQDTAWDEVPRPPGQPPPEKDVKRKLDFRSPKAQTGSLALAEEPERGPSGPGKWGRPSVLLPDPSPLDRENLNNNNSKRSCPEDFEHDAIFGILHKVKPSYRSCAECMYPAASRAPEIPREQGPDPGTPTICTQPTFLPHLMSSPVAPIGPPGTPASLLTDPQRPDPGRAGSAADLPIPSCLVEPSQETPKVRLPKCSPLKNPHGDKSPDVVAKEDLSSSSSTSLSPRRDPRAARELRLLLGKEAERPSTSSYWMQHQESILQLQKAGLVRKHTQQLERRQGVPGEPATPLSALVPAHHQDARLGVASIPEEEAAPDPESPAPPPTLLWRPAHPAHSPRDLLKPACGTPTSSSRSSNLTRSSSSDSLHSVRGRPGLVQQRAQEIETRLRLAGLTVSSPLKRSHSLAKLGSLDFSTEDLAGEADSSTLAADWQDSHAAPAVAAAAALDREPCPAAPVGKTVPRYSEGPLPPQAGQS